MCTCDQVDRDARGVDVTPGWTRVHAKSPVLVMLEALWTQNSHNASLLCASYILILFTNVYSSQ